MMGTSLRPWVNMVVLNGNVYGVPSDGSQMFEIPPSEIPVGLKQFLGDEKDDPDTCTPEEGYLLEEQGREIATLGKRLANAELLIEKLKEDVGHWEEDFAMFDRAHEKAIDLWRKEYPDAGYTPDMSDLNEWMVRRVEKAEAVKESLTSALKEICVHTAHWKTVENGMGRSFAWVW